MLNIIGLALSALAVVFIFSPLSINRRMRLAGGEELEQLRYDRDKLLFNLRDIEFEHRMGKLSDEDYQRLEREYRASTAEVLQNLDRVERPSAGEKKTGKPSSAGAEAPAMFCSECGAKLAPAAKFCSQCGEKVVHQ